MKPSKPFKPICIVLNDYISTLQWFYVDTDYKANKQRVSVISYEYFSRHLSKLRTAMYMY